MNRIKAFGGFWYEFIVGDDWRVAATVVAALAITSGIARTAIPPGGCCPLRWRSCCRRAATAHTKVVVTLRSPNDRSHLSSGTD